MDGSQSVQRILSLEEKRKVLNFTLDNLAKATAKGLFFGGASWLIFRSKMLGLFIVSYTMGMSLRHSNDYLKDQIRENKSQNL